MEQQLTWKWWSNECGTFLSYRYVYCIGLYMVCQRCVCVCVCGVYI